jgi:hypothetical protein
MSPVPESVRRWLGGPRLESVEWPLNLRVRWCDLRPRFIDKGRAGRGYRAVARNGRILLASPVAFAELPGRVTGVRFQVWHKTILPGAPAEEYGVLLSLFPENMPTESPLYRAALESGLVGENDFCLAVGGGFVLTFREEGSAG